MVSLIINRRQITVSEGTTVMKAAASLGLSIPHLCYLKNLNEIGACRLCVVELVGSDKLITACNTLVEEGMQIYTNSPRVQAARRTNLQLVLSQHATSCTTCVRSGNCSLQTLAQEAGLYDDPYRLEPIREPWNKQFPLIRDSSKCVKCMRCIQVCEKLQSIGIWDIIGTGSRTTVGLKTPGPISTSHCVVCGQCVTHCPVGALRERDDLDRVQAALNDPTIITIAQVAPAVRTAWGEGLDMAPGMATEKRLAAALKKLGFNYVFDTNFTADLTIMEEGSEFVRKLERHKLTRYPMFTSCCPAWVQFLKNEYPELAGCLSTAKSPQQMFGAIAKTYFAATFNVDPSRIRCVSIMPCMAKKSECTLPDMDAAGYGQDVDITITTREVDRLIRQGNIIPRMLPEIELDFPLGSYSGAGVIFGASGGVMEAGLRTAYHLITGQNPDPEAFHAVRGMDGWKAYDFKIKDITVRTATVYGLSNARRLIEAVKRGDVHYDFVEIMACPGGCVGGGGQPIHDGYEMAEDRAPILYELDKKNPVRFSHENPEIQRLYREFLGKPLSEESHRLLHTHHHL
ncbi:MAG: [FeFe] hydrogenase, group A [Oscillospiraceae bacterium]|nr:[FeFe] hydrogenase, group A [Oscillospiraceae bacterium]